MSKRSEKAHRWRPTADICPHCGHQGLQAQFKNRRLLAEQCPDCRHTWQHTTRWKHAQG